MIRPISENGKIRLVGDMTELEFAIAPLQTVKEVGEPYRALKALKTALFKELPNVISSTNSNQIMEDLPLHVQLHLAWSSLPQSDFPSPWVLLSFSITQYSDWLDTHSDKELWQRLTPSIQSILSEKYNITFDNWNSIDKDIDQISPKIIGILQISTLFTLADNSQK